LHRGGQGTLCADRMRRRGHRAANVATGSETQGIDSPATIDVAASAGMQETCADATPHVRDRRQEADPARAGGGPRPGCAVTLSRRSTPTPHGTASRSSGNGRDGHPSRRDDQRVSRTPAPQSAFPGSVDTTRTSPRRLGLHRYSASVRSSQGCMPSASARFRCNATPDGSGRQNMVTSAILPSASSRM
jgi:hypothetical protein